MDARSCSRLENGEWISYEKIILALLQQCKDGGLTVEQAPFCLEQAKREVERTAMRAPVKF